MAARQVPIENARSGCRHQVRSGMRSNAVEGFPTGPNRRICHRRDGRYRATAEEKRAERAPVVQVCAPEIYDLERSKHACDDLDQDPDAHRYDALTESAADPQ